jgi:hypothetical protein
MCAHFRFIPERKGTRKKKLLTPDANYVVEFTTTMQSSPITTNVLSSNASQAMQYYVIKFVSDLRKAGGFL